MQRGTIWSCQYCEKLVCISILIVNLYWIIKCIQLTRRISERDIRNIHHSSLLLLLTSVLELSGLLVKVVTKRFLSSPISSFLGRAYKNIFKIYLSFIIFMANWEIRKMIIHIYRGRKGCDRKHVLHLWKCYLLMLSLTHCYTQHVLLGRILDIFTHLQMHAKQIECLYHLIYWLKTKSLVILSIMVTFGEDIF